MTRLFSLAAAVALFAAALPASAATIAIIGTGGVGSALGPRFVEAGHIVVYGSRTPDAAEIAELVRETGVGTRATTQAAAVVDADIVVLAIPWAPAESIVTGLGNLSGKIIIDPINALAFGENRTIGPAAEPSAAALIQSWAPEAKVVKAFNTLTRAYMVDPASFGSRITIPLAGDDAAAKRTVADPVTAIGLEPLDVGGLSRAREVEAMGLLYVAQGFQGRSRFEYALTPR